MCYDATIRWEHDRREKKMLASIITTVLDNLWYEVWKTLDEDGNDVFKAVRYDAELGTMSTVSVDWKQRHAERMIRYDMARLGIA